MLFLLVGSVLSAVMLWAAVFGFLRSYLRTPKNPQWKKIVALALETGAPLPKSVVTPQVRRQLILQGASPSKYSNGALQIDACELKPRGRQIIGFFHPNAVAGGGGERVLWAAIKETLSTETNVVALYLIKGNLSMRQIIEQASQRFNISFTSAEMDRCVAIYLTQGHLVQAEIYPVLTLVGQALGTALLTYEALSNLVPDVFVDTMGLAFSYPVAWQLAHVPVVAYVHYPWVQSDMLASLKWYSPKQVYWRTLLLAYKWAMSFSSVSMANGTWCHNHLQGTAKTSVVYPPCSTQSFGEPQAERSPAIVYLAQFRSEKRHELLIRAFSQMHQAGKKLLNGKRPHLILIGSIRNKQDQDLVKELDLYARDVGLTDKDYTILINSPWENVRKILETSLVGVNAMWNEHFGMGVVEIMAAGLIPVAHASAGPLLDIVKDEQGVPGFLFKSKQDPDYSAGSGFPNLRDALLKALELSPAQRREYSLRAYKAAQRFSDAEFFQRWAAQLKDLDKLVGQCEAWRKRKGLFD